MSKTQIIQNTHHKHCTTQHNMNSKVQKWPVTRRLCSESTNLHKKTSTNLKQKWPATQIRISRFRSGCLLDRSQNVVSNFVECHKNQPVNVW